VFCGRCSCCCLFCIFRSTCIHSFYPGPFFCWKLFQSLTRPNSQARTGTRKRLTTSRSGNLTRLIHTLAIICDDHKYFFIQSVCLGNPTIFKNDYVTYCNLLEGYLEPTWYIVTINNLLKQLDPV
ncbi:unnamed protein product, partial [Ascophyllum nodosum]